MAGALADDDPMLTVSCNESFTHGLLHAMWGMKDRAEMTDFTIKLNNLTIPCHGVVIAAVSDYFHTLLMQRDMRETNDRCVTLQEMDEECLQRVVEYCYTGNINVQLSDAHACLDIAHYLRILPLVDQLETFVSKHMRPENVIGWYMHADKLQLQELLAASKALMLTSFTDVVKHREFHQLTVTELQDYIAQKSNDADGVLDACVSWAQYNVEARGYSFMELLRYIQLDNCSKATLQIVLRTWKPSWPNYVDLHKELAWRIAINPDSTVDTSPSLTQPSPTTDDTVASISIQATSSTSASDTAVSMPAPSLYGSSGVAQSNKLKLFVLGGHTDKNVLNRKIFKIDLQTETCQEVCKMAHYAVKYGAVYCSSKKGLLVVGGSKSSNQYVCTGECSILRVPGFTWSTATSLRQNIGQATAVCVNDHVYTFGDNLDSNRVYSFNMNSIKWARCPDMPFRNWLAIAGAVDENVYVVFNTSHYNEEHRTSLAIPVHCFDSKKRKWSSRRSLPPSVCDNTSDARMVNVKDELFLVGGLHRLCIKYSPSTDWWTVLTKPSQVQRVFSLVNMDGQIVMVGGFGEDGKSHGTIQVYDIAANSWNIHSMRLPLLLGKHHCAVYDEGSGSFVL